MVSVKKAVFPVAGLGTRFLPATKATPKEMLPIVDKPLVQYAVEEAVASGIEEIIFVTGRGKRAIEDHFDFSPELEDLIRQKGDAELLREVQDIAGMVGCCYIRQRQILGLGHAILCAKDVVGDGPFAVVLPDDVIRSEVPVLAQLIEVYDKFDGPVFAVERVERSQVCDYGIVRTEPLGNNVHRVLDLVEKPTPEEAPSDLAVIGRYILTPDIFKELERAEPGAGGEIQVTDGLRQLCAKRGIYGYEFEGKRYDAGNKLGFLMATVEFALERPDLGHDFRNYLLSLQLDRQA